MLHDPIFQPQMVHEAAGPVIVCPFLDNNQLPDAVGLPAIVGPMAVLKIFKDSIIAWMMVKAVNPFLLPKFDVVRCAAFSQHPGFEITDGDQAHTAPQARGPCLGQRKYR